MPKIEQYDWDKLKPLSTESRKTFPIKKTHRIKSKRVKTKQKVKALDASINQYSYGALKAKFRNMFRGE